MICLPEWPTEWDPMGTPTYYPRDSGGNILPSIGGCGGTTTYYGCSSTYQDADGFSSQFNDISRWWYFTSFGANGDEYKCMSSYRDTQGQDVNVVLSDYHTVNPEGNSACMTKSAFDAMYSTGCGQQPVAFNTGVFTKYNAPGSTNYCSDDGSGSCNATGKKAEKGDLGNPGGKTDCSNGAPVWNVNVINMNLYVTDTPLWYNPPAGLAVSIQLSYNSQGDVTHDKPFGKKWTFNYGSYVIEDAQGNVTVIMPDGRQDIFTPDGQNGYTKPFGVYNTLTKNGQNNFELRFLDDTVYLYQQASQANPAGTFLTGIRDVYNQQLIFGYSNDRISTITDSLNKVTTLTDGNSDGLIDQIDDPFGRSAFFEYTNGNLTKITDMGGYWSQFTYDADSFLQSMTNERGTWSFQTEFPDGIYNNADPYPKPGQPMWENYRITITDPLGNKEEYHYYGMHTWHVAPKDYVPYTDPVTNNYKSAKKTIYYIDRGVPEGRIGKVLTPEGVSVKYEYDPATGQPSTITDAHDHKEQYTYNSFGLATSKTDAKNNLTTFEYYPNNIDVWKIKYNLQSTSEDDNIILKTFTYNGNTHDIATVTDRLNTITEFTYNSFGQMDTITEAKNTAIQRLTEMVYDSVKHELNEIKKNGNVVSSFTYDNISRVETSTDDKGVTLNYDYNNLDQVTRITYPDTKFEEFTYSTCCPRMIDGATNRAGLSTNYTYDALKRLTKAQSPSGIIRYAYDLNGNMNKLTDADDKITLFDYDSDNRLIKKTYADNKFVTYSYDSAGSLSVFTNAGNATKTLTYDANHNITNVNYTDVTPDVIFTYDDYNRLDTMTDGIGTYDYGYDELDRVTSVNGPWTNDTLSFSYNELNQIKTLTPQLGQAITYFYDYETGYADADIGRLKDIKLGTNTYSYGYTGVNPLIQSLTRPNGSVTEYLYNDPLKRLTEITNKTSADAIINKHIFTYNNLDLIGTETIDTGTALDSFTEGLTTYNYNNVNQLLNSTNPNQSFDYDDDGNMTQGYTPEGYQFSATYDAENRLKTLQYTDSSNAVHKTEYYYSGDGFLAQIKKYNDSVLVSDTRYDRAVFLPVQERDGNNAVTREYTWGLNLGGGIGGLLNVKQAGSDYSYLYDGKGNVSALTDSSQNLVASYRYDVFGKLLKKIGSLDQPYRFSTKQYDEQTGLIDFGYRFNNPVIGRWMTRDPLGEAGGINLYGFVGNNPVNFYDPYGLSAIGAIKKALKLVHKHVGGPLPKGQPGKYGSPQRGTSKKGYRLDPAHPDTAPGSPESKPHINWWDFTEGKKGKGGRWGAEEIITGIVAFGGSLLDPFDAIAGELADDEEYLLEQYYKNKNLPCE